jgi:LacI family transcriptional regulator
MPKELTKITIHEVAAMAGVSAMTVSRVLRNEPQVAEKTRQAVEEAIAALNYVPLQSARNLSSSIAKVIGLVVPHSADDMPLKSGYEYLSALHLGAMQVCTARDYGLMLLHVNDKSEVQRLVRLVQARQIGAYVVAAPATESPGLLEAMREERIVCAAVGPLTQQDGGIWAASDERAAARELALHVIEQGHREIAYVGGGMNIRSCQERVAGHKDALKQSKIKLRKDWIVQTGMTFEAGLDAGRRLLDQEWIPSAIQCETDDLAAGVIAAAHERGMRLPQDLSVVGFDNFGLAHKISPSLSTAHLPVEEMAAHATAQAIAALEGRPVENKLFACPIHLRQSVTPRPV